MVPSGDAPIRLRSVQEEDGIEIMSGELECTACRRSFAIRGCYKSDELNSLQNIRIHESFNRKKLRSSGSRFGRLIRFDQSFNSGRSTGGKKRSNLPINTKSRFDLIVRLLSSSVFARALDGKR